MAFAIRQERVAVGRDAGNDIRLPELAVSARHAVVITRVGISTVHDLKSSNGTWINGERIESQQLYHGDVVQFGRLSMNYIDESDAAASRQPRRGGTQRNATVKLGTSSPRTTAPNPNATGSFAITSPQAPPPDAPELAELDRLMGSIRSFRSGEAKQNDQKRNEMLEEWKKVMGYCGALKTRLASEPKVRYFEISDRRNEVVVRIERVPGQPTQLLMLTWGHMEQRERAGDGIWMRQPGQADKRYDKCADAMRDLVTTIAHMVA
ncbi:MAG: FHA domain-containing protein [Pseudomonadota bacterium]